MKQLLNKKKLTLQHVPGLGAWTYHLVIPGTKNMRGKWGSMKVSGTIDGYEFKNLNLAPVTNKDKRISINGDIRKAIGKGGGDEVVVSMHTTTDNRLVRDAEIIDCFKDADLYKTFTGLEPDRQSAILKDILAQPDEESQEKKIIMYIRKLQSGK